MKKIISYNLNGIRSALRKGFADWLQVENPDIVCIQETKAQEDQIDTEILKQAGYETYSFSAQKKGYSGVAILTKQTPDNIVKGMNIEKYDNEGRFIRADFGDVSVISVYIPSGMSGSIRQDFKMEFLDDFREYLNNLRLIRPHLIINGDFNICRLWIDIHDPEGHVNVSGFLPEERQWFQDFLDDGYIDTFREFNEEPEQYSWWSYRAASRIRNKGWRIDYNIMTNTLQPQLQNAFILQDIVHSDHCPVGIEIDI
jgi:exodeoxyribonuclease-3